MLCRGQRNALGMRLINPIPTKIQNIGNDWKVYKQQGLPLAILLQTGKPPFYKFRTVSRSWKFSFEPTRHVAAKTLVLCA